MHHALLLLLVALVVGMGCDSSDDPDTIDPNTVDADFLDGSWSFVRLTDNNGSGNVDRTEIILDALDDYSLTFRTDGRLTVVADLSDEANARGASDLNATVPYTIVGSELTVDPSGEDPVRLQVEATNQDVIELTGDGFLVSILLGVDSIADINPSATLTIRRR